MLLASGAAVLLAFVCLPAIAAVDVFHWHLLPAPPLVLSTVGLGLFVFGLVIRRRRKGTR